MANWDPRKDNWLAGFADGEGCFYIARTSRAGGECNPRFAIQLRADDVAVLRELQEAFGGTLSYRVRSDGNNPMFGWNITSKRDLAELVTYFDKFPLRAKKAGDYAIWRQAVSIYCSKSSTDPRLAALRDALMAGRAFDAPDMDAPDDDNPFEVQLALGIDD